MVYRTLFSLCVNLTIIFLVMKAMNMEPMDILSHYSRHSDLVGIKQSVQIKDIRKFVDRELDRQNQVVDQTKRECEAHMTGMHKTFEQAMNAIPMKSAESRAKFVISQVAIEHTREVIRNLSVELTKFREEFNTFAEEMVFNLVYDIRRTYHEIDENKWLSAAKMIHDSVRSVRANGGLHTIRPFMDWAGLQTELSQVAADLKLKSNIPLPNVNDFPVPDISKPGFRFTPVHPSSISLPRNEWTVTMENDTDGYATRGGINGSNSEKLEVIDTYIVLVLLVVIDLLWFCHRAAGTHTRATEILYGYPCHFDCRGKLDEPTATEKWDNLNCIGKVGNTLKRVVLTTIRSDFLPKLIGVGFCVFTIILFRTQADRLVTLDTLESLGYFDTMVAPLSTNHRIANTRISSNADRINNVELRFYQNTIDARLRHYQKLLRTYNRLHCEQESTLCDQHCSWSGDMSMCNKWQYETITTKFTGCKLPRVIPILYSNFEEYQHIQQYRSSSAIYVNAVRQLLQNISFIALIYVMLLAICDLLGSVVWLYMKRFHMLRQQRAYKTDEMMISKPAQ